MSPPLPLLKFPRTAHLFDLGTATSDDLVSNIDNVSLPADENTTILITEKLDGANMGISLSPDGAVVVQNCSHVINSETHRQFRALDEFLSSHRAVLYEILHRHMLFPGRTASGWLQRTPSRTRDWEVSSTPSTCMTARLGNSGTDHLSRSFYQSALPLARTTTSSRSCPNSGRDVCCLHEMS